MTSSPPPQLSAFDESAVAAAERAEDAAFHDLIHHLGEQAAVVAAAPPGAGKSHFVARTAGQLRAQEARVALVAPTNSQAHDLVRRVKLLNPDLPVAFVHAQGRELPPDVAALPGVTEPAASAALSEPLVVATVDKLADAYLREGLGDFDVLVMDEAYQADAARYYTVANVAPTHLLVGDSGQLDPFSPLGNATYWRGSGEDPLQTAVGVLLRHHPTITPHRLPLTRRLDPRAVPVAASFYPGHPFVAAVRPGVRRLEITRALASNRRLETLDRALDKAATAGWAHVLLPGAPVLTADPATAEVISSLVRRFRDRRPQVSSELSATPRDLRQADIAVGVSHNNQKDLLRALLDEAGLRDVTVDTANRLQGLTFEVTVVWHPLAGAAEVDAFHLDPGRLCVLLTRHRHACIVVGRDTDRGLLEGIPPATPGFLGWDPDPVLDGWDAHEAVFRLLEPHVVRA